MDIRIHMYQTERERESITHIEKGEGGREGVIVMILQDRLIFVFMDCLIVALGKKKMKLSGYCILIYIPICFCISIYHL